MNFMIALPNTNRRGFLRTTTLGLVGTLFVRASYTKKRPPSIRWINGATLPRPSSPSFTSAKSHALNALEQGLPAFTGPETVFEVTSFSPNGSTAEAILINQGIVLGTRTFESLGTFVDSVNGQLSDSESSKYWRLEINGVASPDKGISQKLVQTGDTVRLVLGSALNDRGYFTGSLGDYRELLVSQDTPLWRGQILTSNDWPQDERGSLRHELFEVIAPEGSYFIPSSIRGTKHIGKWDSQSDSWIITSSSSISTSASGFIGKSWNNERATSFNEPSTKMFYGGTGTGFPPVLGPGSEIDRINACLRQLQKEKVVIRTVLEVTFVHPDGSSFIEQCEWITLPSPRPFKESVSPLQIKPGEIQFEMPHGESGIAEIQVSETLGDDMDSWTTIGFTDNPQKILLTPIQTRQFARTTRY